MTGNLTISYPNRPPESTGVLTLERTIDQIGTHHMSLDINVMGCGGADESTPIICSCGHHLTTLGDLCQRWKDEPSDGVWDMPEVAFICQCGVLYLISGFDYEA